MIDNLLTPEQFYKMIEKWKIIAEPDGYTVRCSGYGDHAVVLDAQKGEVAIAKCNCEDKK